MKLLINKIKLSNLVIFLRNSFKFRSVAMTVSNINNATSISDAFCWRTDKGFRTIFKYSDILNILYNKKNSYVEFYFYSKDNILLKKLKFNNLNYSNELIIDKNFLNGLEDYGVFYVYHKVNDETKENFIISNRCYLGFSKNNNLDSFVHGNTIAKYMSLNSNKQKTDLVKMSLFKNFIYRVQSNMSHCDDVEFFFANPTSKKIKLELNKKKYKINPGNSLIINLDDYIGNTIKSNCAFLRPVVFNYKGKFIDVYHG